MAWLAGPARSPVVVLAWVVVEMPLAADVAEVVVGMVAVVGAAGAAVESVGAVVNVRAGGRLGALTVAAGPAYMLAAFAHVEAVDVGYNTAVAGLASGVTYTRMDCDGTHSHWDPEDLE